MINRSGCSGCFNGLNGRAAATCGGLIWIRLSRSFNGLNGRAAATGSHWGSLMMMLIVSMA